MSSGYKFRWAKYFPFLHFLSVNLSDAVNTFLKLPGKLSDFCDFSK